MKKGISTLLVLTMIFSLIGCGSKANEFVGTWEVDSVEIDGTEYTLSELNAMGDDSMDGLQIVIKDGGNAYVTENSSIADSGIVVEWSETKNGILIGEAECTTVDGMICLEQGEGKVFFKKISDSQTIGEAVENEN